MFCKAPRGRASISSTLHLYMCHSSSQAVAAQTAGAARHACNHATVYKATSLAQIPCPPCCSPVFTRGQPGRRRDSLSQGSNARAASQSDMPGSYCSVAPSVKEPLPCCLFLAVLGHLFTFPLRLPGLAADCVFPSAFWQRLLAPAQSPGEIYTSPVVLPLVLSTLGRSTNATYYSPKTRDPLA